MTPVPVSGSTFVRSRLDLETVESTNDTAREFIDKPECFPLLILAKEQTKGRGRGSNAWWSDQGSLIATLVFDPSTFGVVRSDYPLIGLAFALAVLDVLEPTNPRAGLRWPNDIEAGAKKLGGILPEVVDHPEGARMVLGFGLNLTTDFSEAPPEVAAMATNLVGIWEDAPGRDELLQEIGAAFEITLDWIKTRNEAFERWLNEFDHLRGIPVEIDQGGTILKGIGAGIAGNGGLRVLTEGGLETVYGGRVLR